MKTVTYNIKDIERILKDNKELAEAIDECPEYFSDDRDDSIVEQLTWINNILINNRIKDDTN